MFKLAIFALINNLSAYAVVLSIKDDNDSLFSDDADAVHDSLASIKSAENLHGSTFTAFSEEDQNSVIDQRSLIAMKNGEFTNAQEKYPGNNKLIELDQDYFKTPRPIGSIMMELGFTDVSNFVYNGDEQEIEQASSSLASAEQIMGKKLTQVRSLSQIRNSDDFDWRNAMKENGRIDNSIINEAMMTDEDQKELQKNRLAVIAKKEAEKKKLVVVNQKAARTAEESLAVHFRADDADDTFEDWDLHQI